MHKAGNLCPITQHARLRPRGYPGDATLLDLIYRHPEADAVITQAPPLSHAIYSFNSETSGCRSLRQRRDMLTAKIKELAFRRPRVLSLACGHLREAEFCKTALEQVDAFHAIDQDELSVGTVHRRYRQWGVRARVGTVRQVLRRSAPMDAHYDFIYAAGLYDYLEERVASRLLERLLDRLSPGGTLWVINFQPSLDDIAYMEACMDWWLIYRTTDQMKGLLTDSPVSQIAAYRTFSEPEGNLAFLEVQKA